MDNEYYFTSKEKPKIFLGKKHNDINDILYYYPTITIPKNTFLYFSVEKNQENLNLLKEYLDIWNYNLFFPQADFEFYFKEYQNHFLVFEYILEEDLSLIYIENDPISVEIEKTYSLFFTEKELNLGRKNISLLIEKYTNKKISNLDDFILGSSVGKNKIILLSNFITENNITGVCYNKKIFLNSKIMKKMKFSYVHFNIPEIENIFYNNFENFFSKKNKKGEVTFAKNGSKIDGKNINDYIFQFNSQFDIWKII